MGPKTLQKLLLLLRKLFIIQQQFLIISKNFNAFVLDGLKNFLKIIIIAKVIYNLKKNVNHPKWLNAFVLNVLTLPIIRITTNLFLSENHLSIKNCSVLT